jgi:hypothetical protein
MKQEPMELLNQIKRVEASGYLLTRIEGKLQEVRVLIPAKLLWAYSLILAVLIGSQIYTSNNTTSDITTVANSMEIETSNQLYNE